MKKKVTSFFILLLAFALILAVLQVFAFGNVNAIEDFEKSASSLRDTFFLMVLFGVMAFAVFAFFFRLSTRKRALSRMARNIDEKFIKLEIDEKLANPFD